MSTSEAGPHPALTDRWSRRRVLLVVLCAGMLAVGACMAYAIDWAKDRPKTLSFAVAYEPFGSRSMLEPGNARAGLDRLGEQVTDQHRIHQIVLDGHAFRINVVDRAGRATEITTDITGHIESRHFSTAKPERFDDGISATEFTGIDIDSVLTSLHTLWRAGDHQLDPRTGRPEPPWLTLGSGSGYVPSDEWTLHFEPADSSADDSVTVDLHGKAPR